MLPASMSLARQPGLHTARCQRLAVVPRRPQAVGARRQLLRVHAASGADGRSGSSSSSNKAKAAKNDPAKTETGRTAKRLAESAEEIAGKTAGGVADAASAMVSGDAEAAGEALDELQAVAEEVTGGVGRAAEERLEEEEKKAEKAAKEEKAARADAAKTETGRTAKRLAESAEEIADKAAGGVADVASAVVSGDAEAAGEAMEGLQEVAEEVIGGVSQAAERRLEEEKKKAEQEEKAAKKAQAKESDWQAKVVALKAEQEEQAAKQEQAVEAEWQAKLAALKAEQEEQAAKKEQEVESEWQAKLTALRAEHEEQAARKKQAVEAEWQAKLTALKAEQAAPAETVGPAGGSAVPPPPAQEKEGAKESIEALKWELVGLLASLDRGFAATPAQAERVDALARQLQEAGGPVVLSWQKAEGASTATLPKLDGRWRLLYSSGFTSGSLGGRRPGPQAGLLPVQLGQVYQDIFTGRAELDNVVDLRLKYSLASVLPNIPQPTATARLRHTFEVVGVNTVRITFEGTNVKLAGGAGGWLDSLPGFEAPQLPEGLRPPTGSRSGQFDVVFLSDDLRISRGDRGELRIYLKN